MNVALNENELLDDLQLAHPSYSVAELREVLRRHHGDQRLAYDWLDNDDGFRSYSRQARALREQSGHDRAELAETARQALLSWVFREHPRAEQIAVEIFSGGQVAIVVDVAGQRVEVWRSGAADTELSALVTDLGLQPQAGDQRHLL